MGGEREGEGETEGRKEGCGGGESRGRGERGGRGVGQQWMPESSVASAAPLMSACG